MIKILVLVEDYTNLHGKLALHYVHTRNLEYIKNGIDVTVLSFRSNENYVIEGIKVITEKEYEQSNEKYDQLLLHAANLKNHYRFLRKHKNSFAKLIFFYHGHEVLKISEMYPDEYDYVAKKSKIKTIARDIYDELKFVLWRKFIKKNNNKISLVFVSEWMLEQFERFVKIDRNDLNDYHIIYNSVGLVFEENKYSPTQTKYDFITIRSNLDVRKYGVDVVYNLAKNNPNLKFAVIGRGKFFDHNPMLENITWINTHLTHPEMLSLLNESRFALFPTHKDSQGVIACEMITYGLPLITSDISVAKEIFGDIYGSFFISNTDPSKQAIQDIVNSEIDITRIGTDKYLKKNTILKEIALIKKGI